MVGCRRVKVLSIAAESTEESLRDFFSFCGDIRLLQMYPASDTATPGEAVILFETESGASTAVLLDNAVVDGARIRVEAFPETPSSSPNPAAAAGQHPDATIPPNSLLDEVISQTINVASNIRTSAEGLDHQYALSNKLNAAAVTVASAAHAVDEKYHVSENAAYVYENAKQSAASIDQRYKISETVNGWMGSMLGWPSQTNPNRQTPSPRPPSPACNTSDCMVNKTGKTPPSRQHSPGKV